MNYTTAFPARTTPSRVTPTSVTPTRVAPRKTTLVLATIAAVLAILQLCLGACAGTRARDSVIPLASQVYERVMPDVERGISVHLVAGTITPLQAEAAQVDEQTLKSGLLSGNRAILDTVDWPKLLTFAAVGVHDRAVQHEVGDVVALSLLERVTQLRNLLSDISPRNN